MKRLNRSHLFKNHSDPVLPDELPLRVELGETFELETADTDQRNIQGPGDVDKPAGPMAGNPWTGPVFVEGISAGEVIAVKIEDLRVDDHCFLEIGPSPLFGDLPAARRGFILVQDGFAHFPAAVRVPIRPMLGCFGVVPDKFVADPWDHGGNMDIPEICAGSTVHIRCQRDGAYFACGDGHARQGEGEINGFSLEVSLTARLTIRRSPFRHLAGILIETPDRIFTVGVSHELPQSIAKAVSNMTDLLVATRDMDRGDAHQFVSHIGDIRLGAVWPLWDKRWHIPLPVYLGLDRKIIN